MLRDYIILMKEKPDDFTGSDEVWETYYIYNSVMDSLTAMRNMCEDKCSNHKCFYTICKAQATISALLEETGRRDRFMKWQRHDELKDMEDAFERSIADGIKKYNSHDEIMSQLRPANKLPYERAISQIKNYKQAVIDIVGDCGFAHGLQKALDILEEDT